MTEKKLRIRIGCRFTFELLQPTPMIALLNTHYSRVSDLETPDHLITSPSVPINAYRDGFGNWCTRLTAPAGTFTMSTNAVITDHGQPDALAPDVIHDQVETLPDEALTFLLGSRYVETDLLMDTAWRLFGGTRPGRDRVQAICDFVHDHIQFDYLQARASRSAQEAYSEGVGVCRDYAHLAIAFCRCMNIPARYCTGYLGDIGMPPPYPPGDFAAYMEVWMDGRWWVFDPRNNERRIGRVLVARGRDAADVPLVQSFGMSTLSDFEVWCDEIV